MSTPPVGPATPSHQRSASHIHFSSTSTDTYQQPAYVQAAAELHNKFVFLSPAEFLNHYFPQLDPDVGSPSRVDYGELIRISQTNNKPEIYDPLIKALSPAIPADWSFENTSAAPDPHSEFIANSAVNPDIALYGSGTPTNDNVCRSCDAELFIELKVDEGDDPFRDEPNGVLPRNRGRGRDTRGQVITYLNAIQASQFRTHTFCVLIIGKHCRLLSLTRSFMMVTRLFDYTSSTYLMDFLWQFSHSPPDVRGFDTTFTKLNATDSSLDGVRHLLHAKDQPLWTFTVENLTFYVSYPFTASHCDPVGRGTRCFAAVRADTRVLCLLKDTWRVEGHRPEGDVYALLESKNVRNIPHLVTAADVAGHRHRCGDSDDFPVTWKVLDSTALRIHQHYRLVLDVIGRPLMEFSSTHDLTKCVLDALIAHSDAYTLAGVEHRDVSAGNIISVLDDGIAKGLLIDWELSSDRTERVYERIGTRQFMSASLCDDEPHPRELADDLESFLLVMLWVAATYSPGAMTAQKRAHALQVFDDMNGGASKMEFITSASSVCFKHRYDIPPRLQSQSPPSLEHLKNHTWMMGVIRESLQEEEWEGLKDGAQRQPVAMPEILLRRKSDLSEYESMFAARRAVQAASRDGFGAVSVER